MSKHSHAGSEGHSAASQVFDIDRVRQLIELMRENELSEIDLRHDDQRIRLRSDKHAPPTYIAGAAPAMAAPAASAPMAAQTAAPATGDGGSAPVEDDSHIEYVRSPMVGTFYSKPNPNSDPYIKVGDHVDESTTVCTVEAMKMFNEIPAGVSGKVVAILVDNEEPVDVNKPLFKIDTRA